MGYKNLYGTVTGENEVSIAFHNILGFAETGREQRVGYKFGKWIDVILFEKIIGDKATACDEAEWLCAPKKVHELSCVETVLEKYAHI